MSIKRDPATRYCIASNTGMWWNGTIWVGTAWEACGWMTLSAATTVLSLLSYEQRGGFRGARVAKMWRSV